MTVEIKIEHNKANASARTPLGLVVELTAPAVTQRPEIKRAPKSVVFVVDNSGSMSGPRIEMVRRAIIEQLVKFQEGDSLAIVKFDHDAHVVLEMDGFNESRIGEIRSVVNSIIEAGSTNLEAGYALGIRQAGLTAGKEGIETSIVLLSDGEANSGVTDPAILGRMAADAFELGITTSTIGIGEGYDERILVALADKGRGAHVAAYRLQQVGDAIAAEIDDLNSRTMMNAVIEVRLLNEFAGSDARVRCLTKLRDWTRVGCNGRGLVGDLPAEHKQNIAFELKLSGVGQQFVGTTKQAIEVSVTYNDGNTGHEVRSSRVFTVDVVADSAWVEPVRDADVVAEVRDLKLQNDKERVYELLNQGRSVEARAMLKRLNLDFEELTHMGLSNRNLDRMNMQFNSMVQSEAMDDAGLAKFLLASKLEREYDRKRRN